MITFILPLWCLSPWRRFYNMTGQVKDGTDKGIRAAYTAGLKPRQNLFSRAVADFMSPPVVKSIGTSANTGVIGCPITIRTIDDFRVTGVLYRGQVRLPFLKNKALYDE